MTIEDCWIDIDEVEPEINKHILTFEKGETPMPIKVNYSMNEFDLKFAYGNTMNITHWMPLPDKPRMNDE